MGSDVADLVDRDPGDPRMGGMVDRERHWRSPEPGERVHASGPFMAQDAVLADREMRHPALTISMRRGTCQ
jgi:hypothetical protein